MLAQDTTDMLTLDFWVEGHIKQSPAQRRCNCLHASQEEIQGDYDEVFLMETGSSIAHMLESTMLISGFRGFSVITVQRGFILGRACGRRGT